MLSLAISNILPTLPMRMSWYLGRKELGHEAVLTKRTDTRIIMFDLGNPRLEDWTIWFRCDAACGFGLQEQMLDLAIEVSKSRGEASVDANPFASHYNLEPWMTL